MRCIRLINASAGSGKTYSLTDRVVEILDSGVTPEAVMATTFTRKAAAELSEKIRVKLLKRDQTAAANRIGDGFIGTVNSICARLLQEYALEAGLSPALDIMLEEDSEQIFRISIDRVVDQFAELMEPAARRLEMDGSSNGYLKAADWRDDVKKIVDLARSNQLSAEQLQACAQHSWLRLQAVFGQPVNRDFDQELQAELQIAISRLDQLASLTKSTQTALDNLKACSRRFARSQQTWSDWIRLAKQEAARDGQDAIRPVNAIADNVLQHPLFQADVRQMITGTFDCAIGALRDYDDYKLIHGLMDFTDQETRVLDLARNNPSFQTSLRDRIQALLVDEFQDTSPIQLALFLALNQLAGQSIWVGDPKQAIYGFRGTDPQLMEEVVAQVGSSDVLKYSWRSKERLISFTNAVFCEVFHKMGKDKVCLKVPDERALKAQGGLLETWLLTVKNNPDETSAIASGAKDLLTRMPALKPGDLAILCRTNSKCTDIAAALEKLGIRASVGQGLLIETQECRLAIAALRYMNNQFDSLALAELMKFSAAGDAREAWLSELMRDPETTKARWNDQTSIAPLNEGRSLLKYWTPVEALEEAISRSGLLRLIKAWPNPGLAISNLDALRGACQKYIEQCESRRSAATVDGFIIYLQAAETEQASGIGEQAVTVLTYHKSKGLEWPWVVLTDLDSAPRSSVYGVSIEAAAQFDLANPLANRAIRYWPWPFGAQRNYSQLDDRINELPLLQSVQDKAVYEEQRLLYVGMTRAKDGLVLAVRKSETNKSVSLKTGWLDALQDAGGNGVVNLSYEVGSQVCQIGQARIPFDVYEYLPDNSGAVYAATAGREYLPALPVEKYEYPIACLTPSGLAAAGGGSTDEGGSPAVTWQIVERFGARIAIKGKPEMDLLGSAVHAYLAVDVASIDEGEKVRLAGEILHRWGVDVSVDADDVVAAGQRLADLIDARYPGCRAFHEWPMTYRNEKGQLLQGWIDLLLETVDGYVIIDHKDYPGQEAEERAAKYIPQMQAYRAAVERATGRPVIDVLLHLPISGMVMRLSDTV